MAVLSDQNQGSGARYRHHVNPIRIGQDVVGTDLDAYRGDAIVGPYVDPSVPQKSLGADDVPLLIHPITFLPEQLDYLQLYGRATTSRRDAGPRCVTRSPG